MTPIRLSSVATIVAACATMLVPPLAQAQTYKVLYSFQGKPDGGAPYAGVIQDAKGSLFGTTKEGGVNYGTVFALSKTGTETRYSFSNGAFPLAGVIQDANENLYGTTEGGGSNGQGTVFELTKTGTETLLHSFCYGSTCSDGANPVAGLIRDKKGNLYGTTEYGGTYGKGTVFEVSKTGTETVLYSFCSQPSCTDGEYPIAGLIRDVQGNLYGTTEDGGSSGHGTVFKLSKAGNETVLYSFQGEPDGGLPYGGVTRDINGNFYGATESGGAYNHGTVFELSKTGTEVVLYSFCSQSTCPDGWAPYAGVIRDAKGNLYGTTIQGGKYGQGTVFKVTSAGTETALYSFCSQSGCPDGASPGAGLFRDKKGNLYGTTTAGGTHSWGVVFMLTP